jgi:hypothetical protein
MGEPTSSMGDKHMPPGESGGENWIRSVGGVAAPLLAGFSFTSVVAVSAAAGSFRWPGLTVLALTFAAITLIAAVQCSYASEKIRRWTRTLYHFGLVALLLGFGFALAPQHATGDQDAFRWAAMATAFVACACEFVAFVRPPTRKTASVRQVSSGARPTWEPARGATGSQMVPKPLPV